MRKKGILLAMVLVFLVSCTHRVNVALQPDFRNQIQPGHELANLTPAMQFFMGEFVDKRPNQEKLATFKQQVHTFDLYEERPISDVLYEGFKTMVQASNQVWNDGAEGDIKVDITFINLNASRNAGLISVGAISSVQIKVDFIDAQNGNPIYSNVYTGQDERSQALLGLMGMVKDSIDASITRCIQSIGDDAGLVKALAKDRF